MNQSAQELYQDYWVGAEKERDQRSYYQRLYENVKRRFVVQPHWKVLDVAGGNGQFMRYLGVSQATVLDISQSGLDAAEKAGFQVLQGDIESRFPISLESYDAVFLFEVLEHLHRPNKTLSEIHHVLKPDGVLYIGQPNMRADGVHHVRRYYLSALLNDLDKTGFKVDWLDYVPAYSMPEAIWSDIRHNPSFLRKAVQCVNLLLSLLPRVFRYRMARLVPDRFALLFVLKVHKKN